MKRMFVIITTLIVLLGISGVGFAKHPHHSKKKDNKDDKENKGRKVPCLVRGVQQMVRSEDVCKDFNGTVVTDKIPQGVTAASKGKIAERKIQSK